MKKYNALSLFSGAGGDTLGLENAGFNVTHFVEFDNDAIKTHKKNFPNSKHLLSLKGSKSIVDIEDSVFESLRGKIDIIFAGFPCQGFSHAGKKDEKDSRNKLFYEFVRATKLIQPRWIIGENVKGLLDKRTEWETNFATLINNEFEEIGYSMIDPKLIVMSDYGIPQLRKRVFFVGNNKSIKFDFPKKKNNSPNLKKIIEPSLENSIRIKLKDYPYLNKAKNNNELNWVDVSPDEKITGSPHPWLIHKINDKEISWDVRKSPTHIQILNLFNPSKTIHSGYVFQPRLFVLMKKNNIFYIRGMNINELKKIQSFPGKFDFSCVSYQKAIKQIGNAVPPKIVEEICKEIIKQDDFFKEL